MKLKLAVLSNFLLLHHAILSSEASNILGVFMSPSPSHMIVHMSIVRALVERGHNVTVVTSKPLKYKNPAFRQIYLKSVDFSNDKLISHMNDIPLYLKPFVVFSIFRKFLTIISEYAYDPEFVKFMKEDNQFDLMLLGYLYNDYQLGLAAHFKCPVVLTFVVQPFGHINRLIGNPINPEFVPFSPFLDPKPMNFWERVLTFMANVFERITSKLLEMISERVYNEQFPPDKYPSMKEMQNNISLVLVNHHFSEGPIRPLVPAMIEIGGIQIKDKPDPLPSDIHNFLENSTNGAIFLSFGSNVKTSHIGPNAMEIMYKTLSNVPYNVVWKIDTDEPLGNASNILFKKWLPQDDILAHKNVKLFITHAGKGSVTEAEYHQVPMVALPVFADQPVNAETLEKKGHGLSLDYINLTERSFKNTVLEVMENDKYRQAIQKFSKLYRDRPMTARQNAIFWIEYVLRHKGAPFMNSPLRDMNILQQNSIDVIVFLIVVIYVFFKICQISVLVSLNVLKRLLKNEKTKKD